MFSARDILYEDNHIMVVNKHAGDLVQPDEGGGSALEDEIKAFIKKRDNKPGAVFLGVVHRVDRPVSGAVVFAKTSKSLARLNEMIKNRLVEKKYWAVTEALPEATEGSLKHYIMRDGKTNRSRAYDAPRKDAKEARLDYKLLASSKNYYLLAIDLHTGRHHQIRAQLSKIGAPIKGDLKYGAARSNLDGGISLHARSIAFEHPVTHERVLAVAPVPKDDNLWQFFEVSAK